jgi:nucleolar complex protein 2
MGKAPKSTKKFQKKHLKRVVDQRKEEQKWKKKQIKKKPAARGVDQPEPNEAETFADLEKLVSKTTEDVMNDKKGKKKTAKNANELESHKSELNDLATKDPEFYKYLKEQESGLLNVDLPELSDDEEMSEEAAEQEEGEEEEEDEQHEVTLEDVSRWEKSLQKNHSMKAAVEIVRAFTAAVHAGEDDAPRYRYTITDPDVFRKLMETTLSEVPIAIRLSAPLDKKGNVPEGKKLKNMSNVLRAFASSITSLLSSSQGKGTLTVIYQALVSLLPYFLTFRKVVKEMISSIVNIWCSAEDEMSRVLSFSFLQTAAQEHQKSLLETIIKAAYGGIVRVSRRTSPHTMPQINLVKNSAVVLFSLDASVSYQLGFQFIRQLAIHLRTSIVNKTAESYKAVYNWQYVHSLDFWSRVISASPKSQLRELIYPLVQVTLGTLRLIPTPQYFPLRFYLMRSLLRLSQQTGVYIPLLPALTEILSSSTINKAPKSSTLRPLDFEHSIRAGKSYLGTRVYQEGVCEQFVELTSEFLVLHSKSIAFPELAIPAIITLKRFYKRSKNIKFNKLLQKLVEKIDENTKFIEQHRSKVDFGPTDRVRVAAFLKELPWEKTPLGKFVVVQRQVREERNRILRESLEADAAEERESRKSAGDRMFADSDDNDEGENSDHDNSEDDNKVASDDEEASE